MLRESLDVQPGSTSCLQWVALEKPYLHQFKAILWHWSESFLIVLYLMYCFGLQSFLYANEVFWVSFMEQKFAPSVCPLCQWSKLLSPTEACYSAVPQSTQYHFCSFCHAFCCSDWAEERDNGGKVSLASQMLQYSGTLGCREILIFQSIMGGMKSLVAG